MVELAIALSLLMAIVYPIFYYGTVFTDLAAWKTNLYLNARDEALGNKNNFFTFGNYKFLLGTSPKRSTKGNVATVEGNAKVLVFEKLPFFRSVNINTKHQKYKEDLKTYKGRGFFGKLIDIVKRTWELLILLVRF